MVLADRQFEQRDEKFAAKTDFLKVIKKTEIFFVICVEEIILQKWNLNVANQFRVKYIILSKRNRSK